ncbi:NUDIX domain-containing protein [Nonomuraea gerenzanensis]|uniref:NUDIX hydrolase n=1 Tax=Nonomuraea gerenzanensis TaxID=93944 RepID=A0A1M4ELF2_9ACTN|nr:NUDIX domain-containing protein [Nonomuraea gerenzanensis]UBU11200.1 NUDIX domain-containing protein [Nonomuraea gerenzanensis]SBO99671.1 NUDIX hydrolase [Nonomuraea gerenzanensis]
MSDIDERPAARVVCLDRDGRVLLMHWYDHVAGAEVWEPPGGRLEPGETPLEAARRELTEETGLPGSAVLDRHVEVDRDFRWLGTRFVKREVFYLARFDGERPAVDPGELTQEESAAFRGHVWAEELPPGVEPPELAQVVERLTRDLR